MTSSTTSTVKNPLGVVDTYTFTSLQGLQKVSSISRAVTGTTAAASRSFTYDSNGYLASMADWNGNTTNYTNNALGLPTVLTDAVSRGDRTVSVTYDSTWVRLPHVITTTGLTKTYVYDSVGEPTSETLADTTTQTVPYSTNGQSRQWVYTWSGGLLTSIKTPNLNTTSFGYTSGGLTSITDALSHVTTITNYLSGGRPHTILDPNSVTTTLTYDARQRLLSSSVATGSGARTTTFTYDPTGELTKTTLPDSSYYTRGYDTAHRLTSFANADSDSMNMTLDALGDVTQTLWKDYGGTTRRQQTATFDALGRMLTQTGVSGETATWTFDKMGNPLTMKDGLSNTTTNNYDALNRLSSSLDANSGYRIFFYDDHDRPSYVIDPNSLYTYYTYNGFGDAIQENSPDKGTSVFHYDSDSNLTQKLDAASIVTNQTFDALDRIITRSYPSDSTLNATFAYDETGGDFAFTTGRLSSITDQAGYTYRSYDERGNTIKVKRTSGTQHYNLHFSYDAASRLANIDYPSGMDIGYLRDSAGVVAGLAYVPPGGSSSIGMSNVYYRPFGPAYNYNLTNGLHTTITLDQAYRTTSITDNASILNLTYAYDNADNVSSITDGLYASNSQTFGYDVINRLTSAASGTGGYGTIAWMYDKGGNLTRQTVGGAVTNYTNDYASNHLLYWTNGSGSAMVSTDANGNITSIPPAGGGSNATFTYNAAQRLSGVTGTSLSGSYVYDSLGDRFSKTQGGSSTTYYTHGMDGALLEENDSGTVTDYVYLDGKPVGVFVPGSSPPTTSLMYDLHDDPLGTPLYATDSSKSVVWSAGNYQPYGTTGTITASITQNLRLPGQYLDVEAGFYHNGARDYMPNLGRYLESDPIGIAGGMNVYLYGGANPLEFTDPEGLCPDNLCQLANGDIVQYKDLWGGYIEVSGGGVSTDAGTGVGLGQVFNGTGMPTVTKNGGVAGGGMSGKVTSPVSTTMRGCGVPGLKCASGEERHWTRRAYGTREEVPA
jgi:RHS repeat-associated protein